MFDDTLLRSPEFVQKLRDRIRTSLQHYCSRDITNESINRIQNLVDEERDRFVVIDQVLSEVRQLAEGEMEIRKRNANRRAKEALKEAAWSKLQLMSPGHPKTHNSASRS